MKFSKFSKNQWIAISGTLAVLIVGFATIYFQQPTTKQSVDHSPGSINTIGQTGGTNIAYSDYNSDQKLAYYDMSHLNALGLPAEVGQGLLLTTPISKLITPFVTRIVEDGRLSLTFQCSSEGQVSYESLIQSDPKWPFAYFYLGACQKKEGNKTWRENIDKARQILNITVTIDGHYYDHDSVLEMIERDFRK